jgi:hypothetical protein
MRAEVLIRGGRILDGTGAPERMGDVVVANGRIAALSSKGGWRRASRRKSSGTAGSERRRSSARTGISFPGSTDG